MLRERDFEGDNKERWDLGVGKRREELGMSLGRAVDRGEGRAALREVSRDHRSIHA